MAEREVAIAEIQSCKLHLSSARDYLTPIGDFLDLDPPLADPQGAYNHILIGISECTAAVDTLQQSTGTPILSYQPTSMAFTRPDGPQLLTISNIGTATLTGTVVPRNDQGGVPAPNWLSVQPQSFSVPQGGSTDITVQVIWNNVPDNFTESAQAYIDTNGGIATMTIDMDGVAGGPGEPELMVAPLALNFAYNNPGGEFTIINIGDQTQMMDWTVTEESNYDWMGQNPTFGQITSEIDYVAVNVNWGTWPTGQGIVQRAGNIIVSATHQGNPAQGSPQTVAVVASRDTGSGPGAPNCFDAGRGMCCNDDPNCNAPGCGVDAWYGWCTRNSENLLTIGGHKAYRSTGWSGGSGPEARVRTSRYFPDANDVIVRMDIKFQDGWLMGGPEGGKHFFAIGSCPAGGRSCSWSPARQENCLRFDIAAATTQVGDPEAVPPIPGLHGLKNGFDFDVYEKVNDPGDGNQYHNTQTVVSNVLPSANTWYHIEFHVNHDPSAGRVYGKFVYGSTEKTFNETRLTPNNPTPLSKWYVGFGNFDKVEGYCEIDNFSVTVGGQTLAI
jgi:hypothetical protein